MESIITIIKNAIITAFAGAATLGGGTGTINQIDQWRATTSPTNAITQSVPGKALRLTGYNCTGNTNGGTLTTDASGNVLCADDDGGGGGGSLSGGIPNTLTFWTSSTNVSATASPTVGTITATRTDATSTLPWLDTTRIEIGADFITDITGTGLSVSSGALTLVTSGDWTGLFDGQEGTWYRDRANHTGTQLASTISDFASTVRTSISETITGIDYNSGTGVFSITAGHSIPLTASTTNWNTFYDTPSTRITAGNFIDWTGNTLDVIVTGDWTGTFDGLEGTAYLARANHTGTQLASTISDFVSNARTSISESITGIDYNSGTGVLSITAGHSIPLTASTTNWNAFYDTPSSRITAGNMLAWAGNTLLSTAIGTTSIDSLAEIESIAGVSNILIENDIDASSELSAIMDDETGSGLLVFSGSPTFTGTALFANSSTTNASTTLATIRKLFDNTGSAGSSGQVLTSNGSTTLWATLAVGGGGITSFNGLTVATQTLATTSANTGWGFGSAGSAHTLNIPTASANVPLGLLSSANWTTFNSKQDALTAGNMISIASNIISATGIATTSIDASSELRGILTDETGTGALMFGITSSMADDLGCTGGQVPARNIGDTAWECVTPSAGGGGGGGMSTTTDNNNETGELISFITTDFYVGGSASNTAELNFDKDTSRLTLSGPGTSAFIGVGTTSSSTVGLSGLAVEANGYFGNRLSIGSTTPFGVLSIQGGTWNTPALVVASTSGNGSEMFAIHSTTTALIANRVRQSSNRIAFGNYLNGAGIYTPPLWNITNYGTYRQEGWLTADCSAIGFSNIALSADGIFTPCPNWSFMEDAAGTTGVGAAMTDGGYYYTVGGVTAANDGAGVFLGPAVWVRPATNTPIIDVTASFNGAATSTNYYIGFTNTNPAGSTFETHPTIGCFVYASSTRANLIFENRSSVTAYSWTDTGIASTSVSNAYGAQRRIIVSQDGFSCSAAIQGTWNTSFSYFSNSTNIATTTALSLGFYSTRATAAIGTQVATFRITDLWASFRKYPMAQ